MLNFLGLSILALLTALTYAWLFRNFRKSRLKRQSLRDRFDIEHAKRVVQARDLQDEHELLSAQFDETIALYDITKEITKHLEEDSVFAAFSEQLRKYVAFSECRYLKQEPRTGYETVLPMKLGGSVVGYLAADGIGEKDVEKFHILGQQFVLGIKRAILYRKVQELSTFDPLTRVFTRRYWFERCRQELDRSRRFGYTACCLMIDVDHFKEINDRFGHLVGDAILVEVAAITRENIRQIDLLGKYGGEELCLLLTETGLEQALYAAERIRLAIAQRPIRAYDEELRVTVSVGVSVFPDNGGGLESLIDSADRALYTAKDRGRNRVCAFPPARK